jgi:tetratricopeptide (TPR) repeat protein
LTVLINLSLVLLTLAVFWQVRNHDFLNFDDNEYITENSQVQSGLNRDSIFWAFTTTHVANWHPLTWLSHMLDFQLFGLNPGGHHFTSVIIHIFNTLLLFLVLKQMTGTLWRSAFVAALFALHPLHVESVAWISERKDVLSTFFWLLTMWAYGRYVERPGVSKYLLILLFLALGLMAKPMLVTLPFVLLLLDYWPLERFSLEQPDVATQPYKFIEEKRSLSSRLLWEKAPFFVLVIASSFITFYAQQKGGAVIPVERLELPLRLANGLVSYVGYIFKMIWPQDLAAFYPHQGINLHMWQVVGAGLLLLAVSIAVIRTARSRPYLLVGWLWYLGTLVPVIGVVQVGGQAMADRYTYVPLIGLFIMIAWSIPDLLAGWRYRRLALSLATGVLIPALMLGSWLQVRYWQNDITLFQHNLEVTTRNHVAHNILGAGLTNQGEIEEAVTHLETALRLAPQYAEAWYNLGIALAHLGKLEEAADHYDKAVQIQPKFAKAHNNLGNTLVRLGKVEEAITHYTEALQLKPKWAEVHNNLGNAMVVQWKIEEATAHYAKAVELKPDYADAHNNLAVALTRQGRFEEATVHYLEALRLKPGSAETHNNFGVALFHMGKVEESIVQYKKALELATDYAEAHNNLGDALARQDNLDEAAVHFTRALQIRADYPEAHNNLGVTLARQGRLNEAIVHFTQALRLRPNYMQARANLELALQEADRPFNEPDLSPPPSP